MISEVERNSCETPRSKRWIFSVVLSWILLAVPFVEGQHNPSVDPPTPCDLQAASIPGKIFRLETAADKMSGDPKMVAEVSKRTNEILRIVKDTWPGQKGFEAEYHRAMPKELPATFETYQFFATLLAYHCMTVLDPITRKYNPTGEMRVPNLDSNGDLSVTAFKLRIGVNTISGLFTRELKMIIDGKPTTVYEPFDPVGEIDGIPYFGSDRTGGRKVAYIGRPNESPYVPITRKQYVEAVLKYYDEKWGTPGHPGTYKGTFSADDIEWDRQDMQRYLRETPESTLNLPARVHAMLGTWSSKRNGTTKIQDVFTENDKSGTAVLITNHAYFRKTEPSYFPQLFVIEWSQPSVGEVSRILDQRFMANFPGIRLRQLLDK